MSSPLSWPGRRSSEHPTGPLMPLPGKIALWSGGLLMLGVGVSIAYLLSSSAIDPMQTAASAAQDPATQIREASVLPAEIETPVAEKQSAQLAQAKATPAVRTNALPGVELPQAVKPAPVELRSTIAPDVDVALTDDDVARLESETGMVAAEPPFVEQANAKADDILPIGGPLEPLPPPPQLETAEALTPIEDEPVDEAAQVTAAIDPPVEQAPVPVIEPARPKAPAAAQIALPAMQAARITTHVKMRAGPADEAKVVTVLPANASVQAEQNCQWCVVVHDGKRGYVYKKFIAGRVAAGEPGRPSKAAAKPAALTQEPGLY